MAAVVVPLMLFKNFTLSLTFFSRCGWGDAGGVSGAVNVGGGLPPIADPVVCRHVTFVKGYWKVTLDNSRPS